MVTTPAIAREDGLTVLATIQLVATAQGEARDDDDAIIDGSAMTSLLRTATPVGACFGQHEIGGRRQRTWDLASARCASVFAETCLLSSLEGAAALVHGIAVAEHEAWPVEEGARPTGPLLAWAVSPDGLTGLCVATWTRGSCARALRLALPFALAPEGAPVPLDIRPSYRPYLHQLLAWQRLTTHGGHEPEATLVTTGTGSGKT